ncbi:MAG: response regulator, partial [Desulfuromonadales bacterium]|nr:response regulator [Desulfuromonadales bacterium]
VNDSLKLLRSTLPATIEIMNTLNQSGAVFIKADTIQLQQVVINLCANAVSAMDEKGLLRITLKKIELASEDFPAGTGRPRGKYAKLSVIDTGSGMTKETMDKIFDPFFTTKAVGVGTGMGLSVVHGIVEQHGGFVTVDSILGQGTSFNIFFPIAKQDAAKLKTVKTESLPTGTERILFVDDEECIAETCGELLEYQGYKVTSVTSSTKALELFIANPEAFDLVFTDQTMPEISGADLATELLKIRPNIPIILCSGYSAKVSEVDAKRIGIRKFCHKPIDMKQLAIVARAVLDESDRHYEEN